MSAASIDLSAGDKALAVLAFRGADAARFLQGQLSADVEKLMPGASTMAGLHNPQGRVTALLALVRTAADEILAVLPLELLVPVEQRLRKYVLRAKLRIEDASSQTRVLGAMPGSAATGFPEVVRGERRLVLEPRDRARNLAASAAATAAWELSEIAAGVPQVYAATSESFVAQMLNLDLLDAIAFDKGCYTGQEVIARAHYRGRVKRRMQRWLNASGTELKPGDAARARDGRALTVVRAAPAGQGGQELLAVGTFGPAPEAVPGADAVDGVSVDGPLPLPYPLPE